MFKNGKAMPDYSNEFKREADDIRNYMRKYMGKDNNKKISKKSKKFKNNNVKTFKMKKKYKPGNYKGPGSKDQLWVEKTFSMFGGSKKKTRKSKKFK